MPDSPEARLGRLEPIVAKIEQRLDDMAVDVRAMAPLVIQHAEMRMTLAHLDEQMNATLKLNELCRTEVRALKDSLTDEAKQTRAERKADRRWMVGTVLAAAALVVAAVAQLVPH